MIIVYKGYFDGLKVILVILIMGSFSGSGTELFTTISDELLLLSSVIAPMTKNMIINRQQHKHIPPIILSSANYLILQIIR